MLPASPAPDTQMISLKCPSCDARIKAPRQLIGAHRPCPRCRQPLTVQVAIPSDSDIHIVFDDRNLASRR